MNKNSEKWKTIKYNNILVRGVPREKRMEKKNIFEKWLKSYQIY